ncbi:MAG: hypothetical protein PHH11_14030 [Methylomonas sp.]|nr:hypothetical protein [Methylomonas sp.]
MQIANALACQLLACLLAILLKSFCSYLSFPGGFLGLQPLLAAVLSRWVRQPVWWLPVHLAFLPAVFLASALNLPSWIYLLGFSLLLSVFWGCAKGDVPLFLSSVAVGDELAGVIEREGAVSLIDLGAGVGSVVIPVAKQFPNLKITAVERAPIPYLILSWRCRQLNNITVRREDFWSCCLEGYDIVFAFLSPSVMQRLDEKCQNEINAKTGLLVSSSFPLPNRAVASVVGVGQSALKLYCYRFGRSSSFYS